MPTRPGFAGTAIERLSLAAAKAPENCCDRILFVSAVGPRPVAQPHCQGFIERGV